VHKDLQTNTIWEYFIKPKVTFNGKIINNKLKQIIRQAYKKRLLGAPEYTNV